MKPSKYLWDLHTRHGYTFVNTNNIRKASKMLTNSRFHRKAMIWYSIYFDDWETKHFRTIVKLKRFLMSKPKGVRRIEKTLTDRQHDTTLLILDSATLRSTGWARN